MSRKILPVIMCGGAGTRVWPESRETMPKQFIALIGESSTFRTTCGASADPLFDTPIVITNRDYRFLVREQLDEIGAQATIVIEPSRRDSGPAVAVAAALAAQRDPATVVAVFAADHVIARPGRFLATCAAAAAAAADGSSSPSASSRPSRPSATATSAPARRSARARRARSRGFRREARPARPPSAMSRRAISGIPAISSSAPTSCSRNCRRFEPEMARPTARALDEGASTTSDSSRSTPQAFGAVAEEVDRLRGDGAHQARRGGAGGHRLVRRRQLGRGVEAAASATRTAIRSTAKASRSTPKNVHIRSSGLLTAVVGVKDVVVVSTQDAVLVLARDQGDKVKRLVEALKKDRGARRPSTSASIGPGAITSRSTPARAIRSSASSSRRAAGSRCRSTTTAPSTGSWSRARREVTRGERDVKIVHENESIFLPIGVVHRLVNPGKINLELIEVQTGSYLGEDDIVRIEDVYNRPRS